MSQTKYIWHPENIGRSSGDRLTRFDKWRLYIEDRQTPWVLENDEEEHTPFWMLSEGIPSEAEHFEAATTIEAHSLALNLILEKVKTWDDLPTQYYDAWPSFAEIAQKWIGQVKSQ